MININLFMNAFLNNQLNEIEDTSLRDKEIYQIIDQIMEKKQIDIDEAIKQLILSTSLNLPEMSMSIMNLYFHNQEIVYQGLKNIYKNFIYKEHKNNKYFQKFINFIIKISCYFYIDFDDIGLISFSEQFIYKKRDYRIQYEKEQYNRWKLANTLKKHQCKQFNFNIFSFPIKRWEKIFLYFSYLLQNIEYNEYKNILFMETLIIIYKRFIQNNFEYKEQKKIVNILTKDVIFIMNNKFYYENEDNINGYSFVFDTMLSQWNLIYPRYQLIIKNNLEKWIQDLINKNFYLFKKEKLLISLITKLKID